jgi:hypothetical protein
MRVEEGTRGQIPRDCGYRGRHERKQGRQGSQKKTTWKEETGPVWVSRKALRVRMNSVNSPGKEVHKKDDLGGGDTFKTVERGLRRKRTWEDHTRSKPEGWFRITSW